MYQISYAFMISKEKKIHLLWAHFADFIIIFQRIFMYILDGLIHIQIDQRPRKTNKHTNEFTKDSKENIVIFYWITKFQKAYTDANKTIHVWPKIDIKIVQCIFY